MTFVRLANRTLVTKGIPQQHGSEISEKFASMMEGIKNAVGFLMSGNFFVSLLNGTSLSALWGMIHSLEIVASYFLLNIQMPSYAATMYELIYSVANYSFLPDDFFQSALNSAAGVNDLNVKDEEDAANDWSGEENSEENANESVVEELE